MGAYTIESGGERSLLVRALYFLLVGWWLTGLWLAVAWALVVSVLLLPVGIKMINRVPFVLTLKRRGPRLSVIDEGGAVVGTTRRQRSLLVRAVYFLLVGWWASGLWTSVAYTLALTVVGLPISIWMLQRLPFVVSLYRY